MANQTEREPRRPAESDVPKVQRYNVSIYRSWCKACGICVAFCPQDVFEREQKRDPGQEFPAIVKPVECTGCQQCVLHCPDFAIRVDRIPNTEN